MPCGICRKNGHAPADPVDVKIRTDFHTDFFLYKPVFLLKYRFINGYFSGRKARKPLEIKEKPGNTDVSGLFALAEKKGFEPLIKHP